MKHALVPVEATEEMNRAALDTGGYDRPFGAALPDAIAASPNGGKVSSEQALLFKEKYEEAKDVYWKEIYEMTPAEHDLWALKKGFESLGLEAEE